MKAIYGVFNRDGRSTAEESTFSQLTQSLAFAGRDGQDGWQDGPIALGQQVTCTTIGERVGESAVYDAEGGLAIVADARLDNRDELSRLLDIPQEQQQVIQDSQLILFAYRAWGFDCLPHLLGDFAFAIWDSGKGALFCGRDAFGLRPFYYHIAPDRYLFTSDLIALLQTPGMSQEVDKSYLACQLNGERLPPDRSSYAAVRRLPGGQAMLVDKDSLRMWRWWQPDAAPEVRFKTLNDYSAALNDLLREAVNGRLGSDYPIGSHFSGDLSASSVAVLAARALDQGGQRLPVFYWAPESSGQISRGKGQKVTVGDICKQEKMLPHYITPPMADAARWRIRPLGDPPGGISYREIEVRRIAQAKNIRVMLSGLGGNAGISFDAQRHHMDHLLGRQLWWAWWHEAQTATNGNKRKSASNVFKRIRNNSRRLKMLAEGRAARWNFIQPEFVEALPQVESIEAEPVASVREGQTFLLTGGRLSDTAEAWAAGGLRTGIEYRYPLLDRRLVEFGLGLPPELFCQRGWPRYLYRYAMAGILPDRVRWRVDFGDKFVNLDRGRINRAFGDEVVWPLLGRLLAEGHEWMALDSEAADQLMKQADRGHWAQLLGALRLEMLVNPAVWQAAESWLEAFDQVVTDRNG